MNSFVNVQVRIIAAQAQQQLNQMQGRLNDLEKSFSRSNRAGQGLSGTLNGMALGAFGSRVQWAGRQLEYNFTLPIIASGAAAVAMALDHEAAMTRIEKVYGDAAHGADYYRSEIDALGRSFETLSNHYGVNQTEVLNVAAGWAAAGASGLALAKSVDLTMKTMVLGEMEAAEATQALISIQAQYGFGVEELTKTVATLNMVENQTGISLKGLVQGFERSAGVARSTGVDVRHLAAMLAALVPATGSAAQAGNALKTIFSRLISPTKETTEVLGLMGIKITDLSWKSAGMTERLTTMAKKFENLSSAQKGVVSSVAASRWQVNKFEVLMRELINVNGYYQRALEATSTESAVFLQMNKELQAVLTSNPRRLQIIWTMLQNAMADIIQPMIPMILWLARAIQELVSWFSELPPPLQMTVLGFVAFLAVVGPLVRIGGALILMFAEVGTILMWLLAPIKFVTLALIAMTKVPLMALLNAMGFLARGMVVALLAMAPAVATAMRGFQVALLTGAMIAGRVWTAGLGLMATGTAAILGTIGVLFRRGIFHIQRILLLGAAQLGIMWRAMLAGLAAIQAAWTAVMAISWIGLFKKIAAIVAIGFTGIGGMFIRFAAFLRAASGAIVLALTGPWGMAITAVLILVFAFWDELKSLWSAMVRGTINAFNALPQGILGAMQAVVNIVKAAAMAVYNLFSYLNPWAHHSPSLVENVTTGMDEIGRQFARAGDMGKVFKQAYNDMNKFGKVLAALKGKADAKEFAEMRKQIKGIDPSAIATFDRLVKALPKMKTYLDALKPALDAQAAATERWKQKLDAANAALDKQQQKLSDLQKVADGYSDQLSKAQQRLDDYANAPIKGMKAMEDAIFNNEMQQKKLRLELMKMEEAVGPMDELESKINAINGQMEMLKGEQTALRNAGAGSEILSVYDEQIKKLGDQKKAIDQQLAPMKNLSDQIDELGRKAEVLDLENSLKFDPLKKQIDDAANSMKELPFDEIMQGISQNKAEVDRLTEAYNKAQAAVDKQQSVVDLLTKQRDAIQARYDVEEAALQKLQTQYDKYEAQIRDIESALKDAGSAADTLKRAKDKAGAGGGGSGSMSPGAENFKAGAGGNFGDPGDFAQIGREGGLGDQASLIDDFTKDMAKQTSEMFGKFNFVAPIKKAWNAAIAWWKSNISPAFGEIGSAISEWWAGFNPFGDSAGASWMDTIKNIASSVWDGMKMIWDVLGPEVIDLGKQAWAGLQEVFESIQPEVAAFRDLVGPMGEALGNLWNILKPVLAVVLGLILAVLKALIRAIAGGLKPFLKMIGDLLAGTIRVIRGIIEFLVGVFTGDWKKAWDGILDIVGGIWDAIWGIISGAVKTVWGLIKGFVTGFLDFFVWLWDELVGHSVVPDIVNDIIAWIKKLPGMAWNALTSFGGKFITRAKEALVGMKNNIVSGWNNTLAFIKGIPGKVWEALVNFKQKFVDRAAAALVGMKDKVVSGWKNILIKVANFGLDMYNKMANIRGKVQDRAIEVMVGFLTKIKDKWEGVKSWFGGLGDRIRSAVGALGSLLYNIGSSIMSSLWNGLKNKWEDVKSWVGGLGGKIQDLKGPIEKDRVLLVDQGAAIMQSLGNGLKRGWPDVQNYVGGVAADLKGAMTTAQMLQNMAARQSQNTLAGQSNLGGGDTITNNFYGDLSFPGIDNESDAEEFLKNLEAITRR